MGLLATFSAAFKAHYAKTWTTKHTETTKYQMTAKRGDILVLGASSAMERISGTLTTNREGLVREVIADGPSTVNSSSFIARTNTAPGDTCDRLRPAGSTAARTAPSCLHHYGSCRPDRHRPGHHRADGRRGEPEPRNVAVINASFTQPSQSVSRRPRGVRTGANVTVTFDDIAGDRSRACTDAQLAAGQSYTFQGSGARSRSSPPTQAAPGTASAPTPSPRTRTSRSALSPPHTPPAPGTAAHSSPRFAPPTSHPR